MRGGNKNISAVIDCFVFLGQRCSLLLWPFRLGIWYGILHAHGTKSRLCFGLQTKEMNRYCGIDVPITRITAELGREACRFLPAVRRRTLLFRYFAPCEGQKAVTKTEYKKTFSAAESILGAGKQRMLKSDVLLSLECQLFKAQTVGNTGAKITFHVINGSFLVPLMRATIIITAVFVWKITDL